MNFLKNKLFTYLLLFTLTISCSKEIPLTLEKASPTLVLNSLIIPDSIFKVQLSATTEITSDNNRKLISTAMIKLYENGTYIETLSNSGNATYLSSINPSPKKSYELAISDIKYPSISSKESIPALPEVLKATFKNAGKVYHPYQQDYIDAAEASIVFKDPASEKNYYEIAFLYSSHRLYYSPYSLFFDNPVIQNEGDAEYNPTSLYFSDELFNGQTFNFTTNLPFLNDTIYVSFRNISYNYYKYRKTWTRHLQNQNSGISFFNDIFKGEPIDMYSNISNGYGIFAGFSQSFKQLEYIK